MAQRTIGAIVLGPHKIQGQYNYMSLEMGEPIDRCIVVVLPATEEVIEHVEKFGKKQQQPFQLS